MDSSAGALSERYTGIVVAPQHKLSPSEYLAWEREQPTKHEYFHGDVFAMAGASARHNALCINLGAILRDRLLARGCYVLSSDQRVSVDAGERYVYPDITVVCGPPAIEHDDVLLNPSIIIEVLSRTTEQHDRGSKWQSYQRLTSLTVYLVVPQWAPRIEHFRRDDRGGWSYEAADAGARITLMDGTELAVDDVFARAMDLPGDAPPP
jgi:Uma2 family endonuclease